MVTNYTPAQLKMLVTETLHKEFDVTPENATPENFYFALSQIISNLLEEKHDTFYAHAKSTGAKEINYLSMEFLMGRSLKTALYNLGYAQAIENLLAEYGVSMSSVYDCEPDAGLGNGGLGRLAACYLDGMAKNGYNAYGYSILYEYGIFKQKIVDGWQTELPDNWLPGGKVWLRALPQRSVNVTFGGQIDETWMDNHHFVTHRNATVVKAVPYDLYVSGYNSEAVSVLRLWRAESPSFDMESFNRGDYVSATQQIATAEAISKVLYPNDNHTEGKRLRLRQQYFLCAASVSDIVSRHMNEYGQLDNLAEKVSIHINDTHPTLAIPELMRILLDDCWYSWETAWEMVTRIFSYTNHTVLAEALEVWDEQLFKELLPRIYQIICEINRRFCSQLYEFFGDGSPKVGEMAILWPNTIRMAHLCVCACHSVNGVSKLHSQIIKDDVFHNFYLYTPEKFQNVTNGIAYRRWLSQSNPSLTRLLCETIGDGFLTHSEELEKFRAFAHDSGVLERLEASKKENKENFANYVYKTTGQTINPASIFDVQVKRLHEYKRQLLNALNIISEYLYLRENPQADFVPKTYIFGAKAASGYFLAKQIIKLLCMLSEEIKKNPQIAEKLSVVYLEDYKVTLSELLMPASEVSEQISLAGKEASGTGNMKLMLNGALTVGTLDGANIEIGEAAGMENMFIFGMTAEEVKQTQPGYQPRKFYESNPVIHRAVDLLRSGINGAQFDDLANSLINTDPYMVLADFDAYRAVQKRVSAVYRNPEQWNRMSLHNIAGAGIFSADRAVREYAQNIWHL